MRTPRRSRSRSRRPRRKVVAIVAAAALAGCGGDAASGGGSASLQVDVLDAALRELGEPCAGAEPFLYAHATAAFRIESASSGAVAARGELPEGTAVQAFNHDPGVARVPTICRFSLHADLAAGDYRLVLPEGAPLPFTVKDGRAKVVLD